jgi:hypothetical protein
VATDCLGVLGVTPLLSPGLDGFALRLCLGPGDRTVEQRRRSEVAGLRR